MRLTALSFIPLLFCFSLGQEPDAALLRDVRSRLMEGAVARRVQLDTPQTKMLINACSWELGTASETVIEMDYPKSSVFSPGFLSTSPAATSSEPVLAIASQVVGSMTTDQFVTGPSTGDSASIGAAVLFAYQAKDDSLDWLGAAAKQVNALLHQTPRSSDGAISHRAEYVQLWSDFVYMVPPFLVSVRTPLPRMR